MLDGNDRRSFPYVLIDLNTQRDFFEPTGACPVINTLGLQSGLRRVIAWAKWNQVPVLSSLDSHRRVEAAPCGPERHCIEGSNGHSKLPFTLFPDRVFVAGDNTLSVPIDLFGRHQQVIFPQRSKDLLANPKADRFISQLACEEFILFGALAESEIKATTLGLLARHKRATVLVDVCGSWNNCASDFSFRQMVAKGATLLTIDELLMRKLPRRRRHRSGTRMYAWPANSLIHPSVNLNKGIGGSGQKPS